MFPIRLLGLLFLLAALAVSCGSSDGDESGGGGDATYEGGGACMMVGGMCLDYSGSSYAMTASTIESNCTGTYHASGCPTADSVGTCTADGGTAAEQVSTYYSSYYNATQAETECVAYGTWSGA